MDALNVQHPHVLTCVSEFVDEIVQFVQHIVDNGYAYKVDGSVYFDVGAFDGKNDHFYAKLEPNLKGNSRLLANSKGLTKYKVKKLAKEYDVQKKLHEKYLVTQCLSL